MKMGCVFSRPEFDNTNPRVFQVWNVDEEGRNVKPGKIEVTESQLILYQKGDITVRWPLRSLRRYGFDAELFSFECGRRCPTGPGIYAFKCRRAEVLFNVLQECIQNSGGGGGGGAGNISISAIDDQISLATTAVTVTSMTSNGTLVNGSVGSHLVSGVDSSGYLEPISAGNHLSCPTSTPSSHVNTRGSGNSPGGFVCIHSMGAGAEGVSVEWSSGVTPSGTLPNCCSSFGPCSRTTSPHYVNNEVCDQASTTAAFPTTMCMVHQYVNSSVIAEHSHRCCSPRCYDQTENAYVNSQVTPCAISPGHLPCTSNCCTMNCMNCVDFNTNYAKLDDLLKQEQSVKRHKEQHFYVNVKPEQTGSSTSSKCVSGRSTPTDCLSRSGTVTSPTSSVSKSHSSHFYANLGSPTSIDAVEIPKELTKNGQQVNYVVLDLDQSDASNVVSSPVSAPSANSLPCSPVRTPEGYATIDFDKTAALSNSANPCPFNDESVRKTRHNAVIPCASTPS